MKTINDIIASVTGHQLIQELTQRMATLEPDFPELEEKYQAAVRCLKESCDEDLAGSVDNYIDACQKEIVANLLFSTYSGYRANLDNFYAPCTTQFVRMDFTDYIREHLMGNTPVAQEATHRQQASRQKLVAVNEEAVNTIDEYFIALNVIGPKVAHYVGYVLSNELLRWMVPGYQADECQTIEYQLEMQKHLGFIIQ